MSSRTVQIVIENLRLRTIVGVNDWEQSVLQDVVITISLKYDASKAVETDDISEAVDYKGLTKAVIPAVENSRFRLLESLAAKVYGLVREIPDTRDVVVTVEKPGALRFCDNVVARISDNEK
jgi:D-erythro-7,8-dihydroneopterin triphosphate epimerase